MDSKIYVIEYKNNNDNDIIYYKNTFQTIEDVCEHFNEKYHRIKNTIDGTKLYNNPYKSNIYTNKLSGNKYVIVYENDWNEYSNTKRVNRLNKITPKEAYYEQ